MLDIFILFVIIIILKIKKGWFVMMSDQEVRERFKAEAQHWLKLARESPRDRHNIVMMEEALGMYSIPHSEIVSDAEYEHLERESHIGSAIEHLEAVKVRPNILDLDLIHICLGHGKLAYRDIGTDDSEIRKLTIATHMYEAELCLSAVRGLSANWSAGFRSISQLREHIRIASSVPVVGICSDEKLVTLADLGTNEIELAALETKEWFLENRARGRYYISNPLFYFKRLNSCL